MATYGMQVHTLMNVVCEETDIAEVELKVGSLITHVLCTRRFKLDALQVLCFNEDLDMRLPVTN